MATYVPAKNATAFIVYIGLRSQANSTVFQANPTIAAGDFKVSIDGGALANLGTLPTVTPAGGKMVKISLSVAEMTGDNITVVCSDAAGAEWMDVILNIPTTAQQVDDLATPTNITAGTITTVANLTNAPTSGDLTAAMKASVTTAASAATPSVTVSDKTGFSLSTAGVLAIWHQLTAAVVTAGTIGKLILDNLDAAISSRLSALGYTAPLDAAATKAQVVAALITDTYAEPAAVPAATSSLKDKIGYVFTKTRNKVTQTATTQLVRNDADGATIATSAVSDDGTTFIKGKDA